MTENLIDEPTQESTPIPDAQLFSPAPPESDEPINLPSDYRIANLRERFAAWVTDHVILLYLIFAGYIAYRHLDPKNVPVVLTHLKQNRFLAATGLTAGYFLYFFCLEGVLTATFGKLLAGTSLRKIRGGTPSIFSVLIRNLFRVIDYPLFWLTGAGFAEATHHHQRLGDLLAGTFLSKKLHPILPDASAPPGGTLRRAIALLFDIVLMAVFTYGLLLAIPVQKPLVALALLNLIPALTLLYMVCSEAWFHTTFGKCLLGLKVLTEEGTSPSFATILLRYLFLPLDLNPLSYLLVLLSRQKQRLGDLCSGTIVVVSRKGWRGWFAIPFMLSLAGAAGFAGSVNPQNFLKNDLKIMLGSHELPVIPPLVMRYIQPQLRIESIDLKDSFKPGERVNLGLKISGFQMKGSRPMVQGDLLIQGPDGEVILTAPGLLNGNTTTITWLKSLTIATQFDLNPQAISGKYQVEVTLHDKLSHQQTKTVRSFQVQ